MVKEADVRQHGFEDAVLLVLKVEERTMTQGMQLVSILEKARKDSPLEPPEGTSPVDTLTICPVSRRNFKSAIETEFGLLTSRTIKLQIFVIF